MIKLIGNELFQWNKNRKVQIDEAVDEAVFSTDNVEGIKQPIIDGLAEIPDILLTEGKPIIVYISITEDGRETVRRRMFNVIPAPKPDNYDVLDTEKLENLLDLLYNGNIGEVLTFTEYGPSWQEPKPGKSAYEFAVDGGYEGTEEDFINKLNEETYNKKEIDELLAGEIAGVYRYKGTVGLFTNLDTIAAENGDVYNVESTGMNYAWNETTQEWDSLGAIIEVLSMVNLENSSPVNSEAVVNYVTYALKKYDDEVLLYLG